MLKKIFALRNRLIELYLEKKAIPKRLAFYSSFIQPGDLIFDIGANVGNRVSIFLNIGAKVVAVEPQPACIAQLNKKFGNKINVEPVCLGAVKGEMDMYISNESTLSTLSKNFIERTGKTRFKNNQWDHQIKVNVNTLDNLIGKYGRPAFCKIDVEGFEAEVLKGLSQAIPHLSFEYCVPEMQDNLLTCLQALHAIAPNGKYNYSVRESMELASAVWLDHNSMIPLVNSASFISTEFGDIYFKS